MLAASDASDARPAGESAVESRARREDVMTDARNIRNAAEAKEKEKWEQAEAARLEKEGEIMLDDY